jgi:beta-aspartyl-peptidase (threonine type)
LRLGAIGLLGFVIVASQSQARRAGDADSVVRAVRAVLDCQVRDWNRGDLDGFLDGYWRSTRVVFQSGADRFDGWDAMRARYRDRYKAKGREMGTLTFEGVEVEVLGPDSAFARGTWRLEMSDGSKPHGLFTVILRKLPEGWRITHDHTSTAPLQHASAVTGAAVPAADEFEPLVHGRDATQFELVGIGRDTIRIGDDGEVRVSGKPDGFFATKKEYKNYVLTFEWMYERPEGLKSDSDFQSNSGLLLHVQAPLKVWPRSIEFQLANQEVGQIYPIDGATFDGKWDAPAARKATKPVGQWNREEVTSQDGALTCTLNGVVITRGTKATPAHGRIGWQSEGVPIRFRKLRIKVVD